MSPHLPRALRLSFWFALWGVVTGLLAQALLVGAVVVVLSPLIFVMAMISGSPGKIFDGPPGTAAYLGTCALLLVLTVALSALLLVFLTAPRMARGARDRPKSGSAQRPVPAAAVPLPTTPAAVDEMAATIMPSARAGDAYAQWEVGEAFRHGLFGLPRDLARANEWIAQPAAQRDPDGQLSLITGAIDYDLPNARDTSLPARRGQVPRLVALGERSSGWRRVAVELILGIERTEPGPWFERAALHGSRYAAFQFAGQLDERRDPADPERPLREAYGWYARAGADVETARLADRFDPVARAAALAQADAIQASVAASLRENPLPELSPDALQRVQRRARMVAAGRDVGSYQSADAGAHAIVYAEAAGETGELAHWFATPFSPGTPPRDGGVVVWLHSLAAREGDAAAMLETARLLEGYGRRVPRHGEQLYAWYVLAAERLQAAPVVDAAAVAAALAGGARAKAALDERQRRAGDALVEEWRTSIPVR